MKCDPMSDLYLAAYQKARRKMNECFEVAANAYLRRSFGRSDRGRVLSTVISNDSQDREADQGRRGKLIRMASPKVLHRRDRDSNGEGGSFPG